MNQRLLGSNALKGVFVASLIAVLVLALIPTGDGPMLFYGQDKLVHALVFCGLYILGWAAYGQRPLAAVLVTGLLIYGGLIELLQGFTSYRSAEWLDLLADGLGLLAGAVLLRQKAHSSNSNSD